MTKGKVFLMATMSMAGEQKKPVSILHLYSNLMNLYGDWANAAVLSRACKAGGYEAVVKTYNLDDGKADLDAYDAIFIGSGTEHSQRACMKDLIRYKSALSEYIESGRVVLATGNSHELFGIAVTDANNERYEALGFFDFETVQLNTRVTGDCVVTVSFIGDRLIGFINRAGGGQSGGITADFGETRVMQTAVKQLGDKLTGETQPGESQSDDKKTAVAERPFRLAPGQGAGFEPCTEGIRYRSFLGTYLTGPILVRNPPLLRYFADIICGGSAGVEGVALRTAGETSDTVADTDSIAVDKSSTASGMYGAAVQDDDDLFFRYQEAGYQKALEAMTAALSSNS